MRKEVAMKATLIGLLAAFTVAAPANAAVLFFHADLTGTQETPPNLSKAFGTAIVTLNDITDMLTVHETFSGLSVPATAAHIHCCAPPGVKAGVKLPFTGFPLSTRCSVPRSSGLDRI
jgi:fructose-specific phosphotransferase system IIC component